MAPLLLAWPCGMKAGGSAVLQSGELTLCLTRGKGLELRGEDLVKLQEGVQVDCGKLFFSKSKCFLSY